jgi:hypothetical protein
MPIQPPDPTEGFTDIDEVIEKVEEEEDKE